MLSLSLGQALFKTENTEIIVSLIVDREVTVVSLCLLYFRLLCCYLLSFMDILKP